MKSSLRVALFSIAAPMFSKPTRSGSESDEVSVNHLMRIDDEFLGGSAIEVLVAGGSFIERDHSDVGCFGDLHFVVKDGLHELAVVSKHGALAGGEGV